MSKSGFRVIGVAIRKPAMPSDRKVVPGDGPKVDAPNGWVREAGLPVPPIEKRSKVHG